MTVANKVATEDIQAVFNHWVETCRPKHRVNPVLSDKRRRKIEEAIRLYGVETCKEAIQGITYSDFHMGANSRGKTYTDIELILRDAEHIERFAELFHDYQDHPIDYD